jgi:hypothetical protein
MYTYSRFLIGLFVKSLVDVVIYIQNIPYLVGILTNT